MYEIYLQKMIYLQFVKMMGMGERPKEKKIEQKKTLFGYPPIPPSKIWRSTLFQSPRRPKTSQTFPSREGRLG